MQMEKKKRYVYLDVLRIAACLCVIYNHVNEYGFFMFAQREVGSAQYYVELFASMLCKMAVPTFFAISGALMLERKVSLKKLWLQRIPRIAAVLVLFSALFFGVNVIQGHVQLSLKTFVFGMYESEWNYAYWYLYAYLASLVALPVLSRLAQCMENKTYIYLFAVAFVFRCLIPCVEALRWNGAHTLNPDFNLSFMTCDIVLYPLMGYFLHHRVQKNQLKKALPVLIGAAAMLTAVSCRMTCRDYYTNWVAHTQTYHELFAPLVCAGMFAAARVLFEDLDDQGTCGRIFSEIGQCTFGVYLIHILATENLAGLGGMFSWMNMEGVLPLFGSFLYCASMMLICLIPIWLLRKIPFIGRLIS